MTPYKIPETQIIVTATATSLQDLISTAAGADFIIPSHLDVFEIQAEDGSIRYLYDGNAPTGTKGFLLLTLGIVERAHIDLSKLKLIRENAETSDVTCHVQLGVSQSIGTL